VGQTHTSRDLAPVDARFDASWSVTQRIGSIRKRRAGRAFTLIELLVVVAILGLLMAIVLGSLVNVRVSAKGFMCKNKLRNVAFDFIQFADDYAHPWRGESDDDGKPGFRLVDFQERVYGIAEFWRIPGGMATSSAGGMVLPTKPYKASDQPLMCPAGPQQLERTALLPMHKKPVRPLQNVSIGMNMRLHRATEWKDGEFVFKDIRLSKRIMEHPSVPLVFDVDGEQALENDMNTPLTAVLPYYSAPPLETPDAYSDGAFWFPGMRHGGRMNVAFIGGHVLSSLDPLNESGWDWTDPLPAN